MSGSHSPRYPLTKTRDTEGIGRSDANALLRQVSDAIPVFLRQYQLGQVLRVAEPRGCAISLSVSPARLP
nr:MAG TPA_asm: hypothetical protein [Caudoviricetes sp.]